MRRDWRTITTVEEETKNKRRDQMPITGETDMKQGTGGKKRERCVGMGVGVGGGCSPTKRPKDETSRMLTTKVRPNHKTQFTLSLADERKYMTSHKSFPHTPLFRSIMKIIYLSEKIQRLMFSPTQHPHNMIYKSSSSGSPSPSPYALYTSTL